MRKFLLAAGVAGAALIVPSLAFAQQSCEPRRDTSAAGVASAAINALLGNPQARTDCAHVYGYYDANGMWHANEVNRASAQGYYDREGRWVVGAPNGYYDAQGRWIASNTTASASGYYDSRGRWVPASAGGYYDVNGQWIAGVAPGHYDSSGRWIPGPVTGYYDVNGRWIATAPSAGNYGANVAYEHRPNWDGAPANFRARANWLEQRIRRGLRDGTLVRGDAERALQTLTAIRQQEKGMRRYRGRLAGNDEAVIQARLDTLNASLRWSAPQRRWN